MFRKPKHKNESRRPLESGHSSAPVFSYSAQRLRTEDKTERIFRELPKTPSGWLKMIPILISSIVIIGSLLYATTLTHTPRVVVATDAHTKLLRNSDYYEHAFTELFSQSIFNYNKLTINTATLAHRIEQTYPELDNVSVSLPLVGRRPVVLIQQKKPAFILISKHGSYLIDASGKAMVSTKDVSVAGLGLTTITDESGLNVEVGETILPQGHIAFITTLFYQLKAKDITIQSTTLPPISNQLHLRLQGKQYYAKFNLQGSALEQVGALLAMEARLETDGVQPSEYIDVRVEDRAYIK